MIYYYWHQVSSYDRLVQQRSAHSSTAAPLHDTKMVSAGSENIYLDIPGIFLCIR